MKFFMTMMVFAIFLTGCSAVGGETKIAPYKTVLSDPPFDVRTYEELVLVSTPMDGDERNGAFNRLFKYISGENISSDKIAMTAPVFMDQAGQNQSGEEIPMTAPVFMGQGETPKMSFVLPDTYTFETAPKPTDENVMLSRIQKQSYAVIRFSGRLTDSNFQEHETKLRAWMKDKGYEAKGAAMTAGYNAPWTLPMLRRNEVLIPVEVE